MLKFREWLIAEAQPTLVRNPQPGLTTMTDPNMTHDLPAQVQAPAAGGDSNGTVDHIYQRPPGANQPTHVPGEGQGPLPSNEYARLLVRAFQKLDPHINDRGQDGQIPDAYSGTPAYSSPEQARPVFNTQFRHESDNVEDAISWYAKLYPDQVPACQNLATLWHALVQKVRAFLSQNGQMREAADHNFQHPVMYQTTMMTIRRVNRGIASMKTVLMRQCPDPTLREAFVQFVQAWEQWFPTAMQSLQGHEREATSRHNQQTMNPQQQQKPQQGKGFMGWLGRKTGLWGGQNQNGG